MDRAIQIKGTREGLTITLGSADMATIMQDLGRQLRVQGAFFRGGTVALQIIGRALSMDDVTALQQLLAEHEMSLKSIVTDDELTKRTARQLDLKLVEIDEPQAGQAPAPARTGKPEPQPAAKDENRGVLVRRIVRSGQTVRHNGHIVVIGDVNTGAEILAGGDIVIWGRLRGLAHAGCHGDDNAVVCALEFTPQQVRIGRLVARSDEQADRSPAGPEVARIFDNAIVIESWDQARRKA